MLGWGLKAMAGLGQGDPEKELAQMKNRVSPPDYAWFAEDSSRFATLGRILRESLRAGTRGAVWDLRLYVREFDFSPTGVRRPLTWFHGRQDANAPLAMVQRAMTELQGAQLVIHENDAHLSMSTGHLAAVSAVLRDQN